jgi:CIC family chloride channel protein
MLLIYKKLFLSIKSNVALLITAVIVGIIVSFVAQFFILSAKSLFSFFYLNSKNFLVVKFFGYNMNYSSLIICLFASIIICLIIKIKNIDRWHGPADTIYAAHQKEGTLDTNKGFISTIASFISISGGASVGIYGPLVHFGGTLGAFLRRKKFMPIIPHDIIIGSGVAAAISAGFGSPLAGILFAHEVVLRHFSMKAITSIALSSITASVIATQIGLVEPPFRFEEVVFNYKYALPGLITIGFASALISLIFMNGLIISGKLAKKTGLKNYYTPIIPGLLCGLVGCFVPEALGLGLSTVLDIITTSNTILFLIILLISKIFLTSMCIGFGLFGGTFSPAIFIGATVGALLYHIPFLGISNELQPIFVVAGMAAVSSSVIGAPITAIILILELTGSYKYAIASIFPIVISNLITYLSFGSSFFDKQLSLRGINMSFGREHIMLSQKTIESYASKEYVYFEKEVSINNAIKIFKKNSCTEGYFLDDNKIFIGKLRLIDIINKKNGVCYKYREKKPILVYNSSSISDSIKILSDFVGESVPVLNKKSNFMIGIISENDVLKSYTEISNDIRTIEK